MHCWLFSVEDHQLSNLTTKKSSPKFTSAQTLTIDQTLKEGTFTVCCIAVCLPFNLQLSLGKGEDFLLNNF